MHNIQCSDNLKCHLAMHISYSYMTQNNCDIYLADYRYREYSHHLATILQNVGKHVHVAFCFSQKGNSNCCFTFVHNFVL